MAWEADLALVCDTDGCEECELIAVRGDSLRAAKTRLLAKASVDGWRERSKSTKDARRHLCPKCAAAKVR